MTQTWPVIFWSKLTKFLMKNSMKFLKKILRWTLKLLIHHHANQKNQISVFQFQIFLEIAIAIAKNRENTSVRQPEVTTHHLVFHQALEAHQKQNLVQLPVHFRFNRCHQWWNRFKMDIQLSCHILHNFHKIWQQPITLSDNSKLRWVFEIDISGLTSGTISGSKKWKILFFGQKSGPFLSKTLSTSWEILIDSFIYDKFRFYFRLYLKNTVFRFKNGSFFNYNIFDIYRKSYEQFFLI